MNQGNDVTMPEEQYLEDGQKPEEKLQNQELYGKIYTARKKLRARNTVGLIVIPAFCVVFSVFIWIISPNNLHNNFFIFTYSMIFMASTLLSIASIPIQNYLQYGKLLVWQSDLSALISRDPSLFHTHLSNRKISEADGSLNNTSEVSAELRPFEATRKRLRDEIELLARRGNLNLTIGVLTTIVGVVALAYVVLSQPEFPAHTDPASSLVFFTSLLSRLSVAIFIEVFAFFFLRLYKSGLEDIRYYQNEITNIESKETALLSITNNDTCELKKVVIEVLSKTERNGLLKKGETTVALERDRIERNELVELSKLIVTAYKK